MNDLELNKISNIADKQIVSNAEANKLLDFFMGLTLVEARKAKNFILDLREQDEPN